MGGDTHSNKPRRTTVKSGCRTCKIRKKKCDEGRPACYRCVSTGRVCDGYGIWGGGGNFYGQRESFVVSRDRSVNLQPPAYASILATSTEEKRYFEWFKHRTAKKLPGAFVLAFWDTLLFQASQNEPAVLHAILTLSSVQKRGIIGANDQGQNDGTPDEQEQFMLQHYIKAIRHLEPHFLTKDRASVRVALITCVVFICLEFLRGHFRTAETHLQNGLRVLRELQTTSTLDDGILFLEPFRDSIDDWIVEAFSRLHVQVELFKYSYKHPCSILHTSGSEPSTSKFLSRNGAWQQLERLLNKIFHLTERGRQRRVSNNPTIERPSALLEHQQQIQAELVRWLAKYEASKDDLESQERPGFVGRILLEYHTMASMMTDACLCLDDESIFDSYTEQFVSLINQSAYMWECRLPDFPAQQPLPRSAFHMSRSIVDIGWIPPLYYTALKCRVHRIRLQAIRLLESASHREGIWDSKIAARVARKVMEIEERDFYKDVELKDVFPLSSSPEYQDLSLPTPPQSYRIQEVKVVLSDGPMDSVMLSYVQKEINEDWKDIQVSI
ncbi:uncharacterized protein BDR25DRAFT_369610 [Lindgomyces ingoldianus]|uniref:Uncharacterized protein n=1 Tax=Lindgomyces ingoldianus TaxID=673940 RepID=A0ACB6QU70_9PLEO|nr:uncharacterized protein BDR25DRAFT_369610 [Lindgomyces ingoldianus]KAF2470426.1 hypothetical protein BDR25DRAFT_369610 [Lindgomyces ingoldianus]